MLVETNFFYTLQLGTFTPLVGGPEFVHCLLVRFVRPLFSEKRVCCAFFLSLKVTQNVASYTDVLIACYALFPNVEEILTSAKSICIGGYLECEEQVTLLPGKLLMFEGSLSVTPITANQKQVWFTVMLNNELQV